MLLLGVEHEDRLRQTLHVTYSPEVALQLGELSGDEQRLLLGHRLELAGVAHPLVFLHLADAFGDGLEVGEHPAQPALVDVGHVGALSVGLDRVLGLLLGADEEHSAAVGDEVANEDIGLLEVVEGLMQVHNMDPRAFAVDEAFHLRVPAAGLVTEVETCLQQLLHGDYSHV